MVEEIMNLEKMCTTKNAFRMSMPIFIELLLQLLVGNVDQIMVSHYSQSSVAAIVNGNQIISIIIVVINMMCMATTVVLSQYLGAKDKKGVNQTCTLSTVIIIGVGAIATMITVVFGRQIFTAMHVEAGIMKETCTYLGIVGGFTLVQALYLNFAAILRSHTFMKQVMYASIVMNVINIGGNAILIGGLGPIPALGIVGAAVSTVTSKTIGLLLVIILLIKKTEVKLTLSCMKEQPGAIVKKLFLLGFPSGAESLSYQMSQIMILAIINMFGSQVTATKGYCSILANFAYVYAVAIAQATQIIVGYLLGAMQLDAIAKRVWSALKIGLSCCVGITALMCIFSDTVFLMFTNNPEIMALGHRILCIEIVLEIGRAINILMTRMLIAVGDAVTPMVVGITGHWLVAYAFAYLFGLVFNWGLEGVWIAMAMDECARGIIYWFKFRSGRWKRKYTEVAK
jgi:putative MATE family efflux protein